MIRLARFGARKQPFYRIVVIEKDRARNGRSIEVVGTYNPRTNPATVDLKHERIAYWRSKGAQFSPTVEKLVKKNPVQAVTAEPVLAPVAAKIEAPVAAKVEAPVEAVIEAPVEVVIVPPVEVAVEAPAESSVAAPVEA